ncbi:MAG: D-alanine--D-alanine ligase family protein [Microthrixaceae bacterium]
MPSTDRTRLVILFGGHSAEHDISRISAFNVMKAANPNRYQVSAVGIGRDGVWRHCGEIAPDATALEISGEEVDPFEAIAGGPRPGRSGGDPDSGSSDVGTPHHDDSPTVVFPVLHGPNGEDGTVQGLLEVAGVAYVGSGVLGSAVSMDKAIAKTILGAHGIAQPAWRSLRRDEVDENMTERATEIIDALGMTLFVKPANMGSSIGVSKTHDTPELVTAIELALNYDDVVVIEEAVNGREIETAVLGNESPLLGSIGEVVAAADFYDYEDKYSDGSATTVVPAELRPETEAQIKEIAVETYRALRAEGLARVDLFVDEDKADVRRRVLVNEINTIPGFTPISMYPQLWEHAGVSYSELIDRLVELALERHERLSRHHVDVISSRHQQ